MRTDCDECRNYEQEYGSIGKAILKLSDNLQLAELERNSARVTACKEAIETSEAILADFRARIERHTALMHAHPAKPAIPRRTWGILEAFREYVHPARTAAQFRKSMVHPA